MLTASRTESGPRDSRARSDSPSTNGMMKNGSRIVGAPASSGAVSPALSTGTMCGCCSAAESMISRLNRSTETVAASSYGSTLMTTRATERIVARDEHRGHAPTTELALEGVARS